MDGRTTKALTLSLNLHKPCYVANSVSGPTKFKLFLVCQMASLDPVGMLRDAMNLGERMTSSSSSAPALQPAQQGWDLRLKESYQKMLLDMQARHQRDKLKLEAVYKRELEAQVDPGAGFWIGRELTIG